MAKSRNNPWHVHPGLRWGSTVVALVALLAAIATRFWCVFWVDSTGSVRLVIRDSAVYRSNRIAWSPSPPPLSPGWHSIAGDAAGVDVQIAFATHLADREFHPPLITIAVLAGLLAILFWRLHLRPDGDGYRCETCGYDLRGNVSGRCPECGSACVPDRGMHRRTGREGRFCEGCGYDLTGNVSGRCPECGRECVPDRRARRNVVDDSSG